MVPLWFSCSYYQVIWSLILTGSLDFFVVECLQQTILSKCLVKKSIHWNQVNLWGYLLKRALLTFFDLGILQRHQGLDLIVEAAISAETVLVLACRKGKKD